jgi:tetratricopeptide (TPR) repeat protein
MISHLLGTEELDKAFEEFILEKTEGVPFLIEELIKSLKDLKIIEREDNKYRITKDIKEVAIPATVQDVIMARVDSLPEGSKSLLQTMSVIGREFSYDLIKRITDLTEQEQELLSQLSVLKDAELLYERGIYPQSTYIFKHALTQEVTYNSLLIKKRKEIHEKIAATLEALYPERLEEHCELLAYHYAQSANTEKAVEYLELANHKSIRINAMEEAKAYFDQAMELLESPPPETYENRQRRISLLVKQGEAFFLLLKTPEYYELLTQYETMARELENAELLGAFYARFGYCDWAFGHFEQAIQRLTKAAELCETAANSEEATYSYTWLKWSHLFAGNFYEVFGVKQDILRTMDAGPNLRWYVWGLCAASRACSYLGRWDQAVEAGQKALNAAETFSDNSGISFAAYNLSMAYTSKGDLARAVEYGELAVHKAPTLANKAFAQFFLGWALCRAGKTDRGIELLTSILPVLRAQRFMPSVIPTTCSLGEGYWLAGEKDNARQTLKEALEIAERCGAKYYAGWAHRLLGELALETDAEAAAAHFEKSIAVLQEINAENELALAYGGHGRLHKQQGQMTQAREYLTKDLEILERLGTLIEPDKVREELAELGEQP